MMKERLGLTIIAIIAAIVVAFSWCLLMPRGLDNPLAGVSSSDVQWKTYFSRGTGLSFEYPEDWRLRNNSSSEEQSDLMICPPEINGMTSADYYCIVFYTRDRLLHPRRGFYDESELFSDFSEYMKPYDYDYAGAADYRFIRFNYLLHSESDSSIDLLGLYRQGRNDMIGLSQRACIKGVNDECLSIFKYVLDSITFN